MKKSYLLGVTAIALTFSSFGQVKTIDEQEIQAGSGVFFGATMDDGLSQLTMTMKGPDDRWCGLGFGSFMSNADVLLYTDGKVGPGAHPLDAWDYDLSAQNAAGVVKDGIENWTITSNTVAAGVRTVIATRALNSGDPIDHVLNFSDATVDVIWAKGDGAGFTLGYHGGANKGVVTLAWSVPDVTEPALSVTPFNPADNQIDVAIATNLTATFDEDVVAGIGSIELRLTSTDALVESFDVTTDATFTGNQVSLNPATDLVFLENYYVVIPNGAIEDVVGNVYSGFSDNTTWNFTAIDEISGIDELFESFQISLNNSGDIVITNLTSEDYSVELVSINGQILENIKVASKTKIIKGDKFNNQSILVHVITENGSISKLIKL